MYECPQLSASIPRCKFRPEWGCTLHLCVIGVMRREGTPEPGQFVVLGVQRLYRRQNDSEYKYFSHGCDCSKFPSKHVDVLGGGIITIIVFLYLYLLVSTIPHSSSHILHFP